MPNSSKLAAQYQAITGLMAIVLGINENQSGFVSNGMAQIQVANKIDNAETYRVLDEIHDYLMNLSENVYKDEGETK